MEINIKTPSTSAAKRKLSPLQEEYRKFIAARLSAMDKSSPFEGSQQDIIDFFGDLSEDWAEHKKTLKV